MVCLVMVSSIKTRKVLAIVILSEVKNEAFLLIFSYDFSLVVVFIVTVGSNIIFSVHNKVMPKPHLHGVHLATQAKPQS